MNQDLSFKNENKILKEAIIDDLKDCSNDLNENSGDSSIDSTIEFLNQNEISNRDEALNQDKENIAINNVQIKLDDEELLQERPFKDLNLSNLSYLDRSIDRSKTSIDDLSFSQKTLIKSCSLRSLITDLINDEILLDKNELSKNLDEFEKEKFFQIIKVIKQEESEKKIEQLKELCKCLELVD